MGIDMEPLIIDSFAGGGGASTGIERALGRSPDIAINHSGPALALHAANHPDTLHLNSNIWDVDPVKVCEGRKVGLLWASPDCKHFSKAKGGAVRDRNIRDLAWIVVDWAEKVKPDVICMENVEEFVTWGPLSDDGKIIKEFVGMTYELWLKRLKAAGYKVQSRELRACDYGAPTIRKRWFLVARRDGRAIVWPKPTHGDPESRAVRQGKLKPWRTAAECIDWSIPCPSIFDTAAEIKKKHGLRAIRPLADNTMARIARGIDRYVLTAKESARSPYIVNLTHGGRVESLDDPFKTITGANRGEKAVAVPSLMSMKGTARRDSAADAPHPTVLAGGGHSALISPFLATMRNSQKPWQGVDQPTHTVTAGGAGLTCVTPYLASIAHGDSGGRREYPLKEPMGTVTVGGVQHAVVAPVLTQAQHGGSCRPVDAPSHTICASKKDQNSMIAATMVHVGNGEREGQAPRALDISAPLNTVVAGGVKQYPVAAFLAQQNGGRRMEAHAGHELRAPMSTVAGTGSHQTPVAAFLTKYYGQGTGARLDEPCHTVTVDDRFGHIQADLAAPPFRPEHEDRAREVAAFLRAHGVWGEGEFVTLDLDGETFVVIDIGLRMLTPRELFKAQGFPSDYVIEGIWTEEEHGEWSFTTFSKHVQISCCGNSVCPDLAEALVGANAAHLALSMIGEGRA